jgi:hypothetical protein
MAKAEPDISKQAPSEFDKFVRRIAAIPKAKVDALEAAEQKPRKRRRKAR